MRIIAGFLGGRLIESPHNNKTHPMSEKMRGALFNSLGDINALTFLDAFAGTGACGFEAISRGAKQTTLLEVNPDSFKTIVKNAEQLDIINAVELQKVNCARWSSNNKSKLYDVIIADPPYNLQDINLELVFKLSLHLKKGGIFVVSAPPSQHSTVNLRASKYKNLLLISHKTYADGGLYYYRNNT